VSGSDFSSGWGHEFCLERSSLDISNPSLINMVDPNGRDLTKGLKIVSDGPIIRGAGRWRGNPQGGADVVCGLLLVEGVPGRHLARVWRSDSLSVCENTDKDTLLGNSFLEPRSATVVLRGILLARPRLGLTTRVWLKADWECVFVSSSHQFGNCPSALHNCIKSFFSFREPLVPSQDVQSKIFTLSREGIVQFGQHYAVTKDLSA
jgi:hypothetical protein